MSRKTRLLRNLIDRLCIELDNELNVFIEERPFLVNKDLKPEILDLSIERSEVEIRKNAILKELLKLNSRVSRNEK